MNRKRCAAAMPTGASAAASRASTSARRRGTRGHQLLVPATIVIGDPCSGWRSARAAAAVAERSCVLVVYASEGAFVAYRAASSVYRVRLLRARTRLRILRARHIRPSAEEVDAHAHHAGRRLPVHS